MAVETGDIPLSANFNIAVAKPIDPKFKVGSFSDLVNIPFKYGGLATWVIDEELTYVLNEDLTTWLPVAAGSTIAALNTPVIKGTFNASQIPLLTFQQNDGTGLDSNVNMLFGINVCNTSMTGPKVIAMGNQVAPLASNIEGCNLIGSNIGNTLTDAENTNIIGLDTGLGVGSDLFFRASNIMGKGNLENADAGAGLFEVNVMGALNLRDYISDPDSYLSLSNVIGHRILRDATATNTQFDRVNMVGSDTMLNATLTDFLFKQSTIVGGNCLNLVATGVNEFNAIVGIGIFENGEILGGFDFNTIIGVANINDAVTGGDRNTVVGSFNARNARNFDRNTIVGFTCSPDIGTLDDVTPTVYKPATDNLIMGANSGTAFKAGANNVFINGDTSIAEVNGSIGIGGTVTGDNEIVIGDSTKGVTIGGIALTPQTTVKTPTSTGIAGQVSYNSGFLYTCVATDTWVRRAVDTAW